MEMTFHSILAIEEMNLNNEGKVELKGDKTLEIKWSENDTMDYEAKQEEKEVDCLESENLNGKNEFLWIEDFEGLVNRVQELKASNKRGENEDLEENSLIKVENSYILEIDNSFGISEKIGKKIGVNPTWLKKCSFKITF